MAVDTAGVDYGGIGALRCRRSRKVPLMMGWYGNDWGVAGVFGMLLMLAFWGGLIALAVWAISRITRSDHPQTAAMESPRTILDRRFAAGDLDAEGYAQARRILEGHTSQPSTAPPT
ncbi:MAG: hypothetical protein PSX37_10400 [bacterium]|nr:hypothetical protein [bacterium]